MKKTIENVRETFYTYWKGQEISDALNKIASIFQSASSPLSLKQFDELYLLNSDETPYQAHRIINRMEKLGILHSEKRKEEFITKKKKEWIIRNAKGEIIPEYVRAIIPGSLTIVRVLNPDYEKRYNRGEGAFEKIDEQIQVTRKYYTWVG